MDYNSTRGNASRVGAAYTIVKGLASDGGLFVPADIPEKIDLPSLNAMGYQGTAIAVFKRFLTDFSSQVIEDAVQEAYNPANFDHPDITPLVTIKEKEHVLELWHGPTSAFKDIALQILPHLLKAALSITDEKDEIVILTATSGDTGKSALEGFRDVEGISIIVYYPEKGVSTIQKLQMITQEGSNVSVAAVRGNFDDAQRGVKEIFGDPLLNSQLAARHFRLSSANSINWGRLLPQIVYYFKAYTELVRRKEIVPGDRVNFIVPTGNFGNILAGFYAKQIGLPVNRLICASNSNNVLTEFMNNGVYNSRRELNLTLSPSMDILISSNLERLLFEMNGHDPEKITAWMEKLKTKGIYSIDSSTITRIKDLFYGGFADDVKTLSTIHSVYENHNYLLDPHTAVGKNVLDQYLHESGDRHHNIILATASPYKFAGSVLKALNPSESKVFDGPEALTILSDITGTSIPENLSDLAVKKIRHNDVVNRDAIRDHLLNKLQIQ